MKYILLLLISFSAMADDAYEADLKDRIANKDTVIEKLKELNATTAKIAERMIKQNAKTKKRTMYYFDKIIRSCRLGDEVGIPGSDGVMYRISCEMVEVVK